MSFDHAVTVRRLANAPMSDAEWQVRCDLAACYRLACRNGWDDLIYTHISAAVPGPEHHFLTNPFGLAFDARFDRQAHSAGRRAVRRRSVARRPR